MQGVYNAELVCSGCIKELDVGDEYLQCMSETCGKLYHVLCINKMPTFEDRNTWVCPECCNAFKRGGRNCDIPVGTPVTTKNITIRNRSEATFLPPESTGETLVLEMELIRNQMTLLTEQLADAVSTVAKYHVAFTDCSRKLEIVSERLVQLELSSPCLCRCADSGPLESGKLTVLNEKTEEGKHRTLNLVKTAPTTNSPIVNVDNESLRKSTYAAVSLESSNGTETTQDVAFTLANERAATGEWQEVRNRKKRFSSVRCTAGPQVTTLRAVEYRRYIHLWNMVSGVDEIRSYLQLLCPEKTCTVEELKPKGEYKSYKIGVPQELYEKCLSAEVWPENARVKAWLFRKPQNKDNTPVRSERKA